MTRVINMTNIFSLILVNSLTCCVLGWYFKKERKVTRVELMDAQCVSPGGDEDFTNFENTALR